MTEIMPVPTSLDITALPAGGFPEFCFFGELNCILVYQDSIERKKSSQSILYA